MLSLDLGLLNRLCGAGAVSRGRIYYEAGRVIEFKSSGKHIIIGKVKGSHNSIYQVALFLNDNGDIITGDCSCPISTNCKHVVALALAAAGTEKEFGFRPGLTPNANGVSVKRNEPDWKRRLESVLLKAQDDGSHNSTFGVGKKYVPLGLQFRIDGLIKDQARRRAVGLNTITGISVRPVQQSGSSGAWTGGYGVSWDALRRADSHQATAWALPDGHREPPWDPDIMQWLGELAAMRSQGYWGTPEWTPLSDFPDRLLWGQLQQGTRIGVPFVGTSKRDVVKIANQAELTLDITKTETEAHLASVLKIDEVITSSEFCGNVGHRGLYVLTEPQDAKSGWVITLAPTAEPLTRGAIALLELGSELVIPESDYDAFMREYLPKLRHHLPAASSDSSIEIPETPAPTLVVTVTFPKPTQAQLSADWEYVYPEHLAGENGKTPQAAEGGVSQNAEVLSFRAADVANHPVRDFTAERQIWGALTAALTEAGLAGLSVHEDLGFTDFAALKLVSDVLPIITKVPGVRTELVGNPEFIELTEQPVIELAANESQDADWFDLAVTVRVAEREIPLPNLLEALHDGKQQLMLVDGSWLRLNHPSLDQLRRLLDEASQLTDRKGKLQVSRYQAGLWDELAELADVVEQSDRWRESVSALLALLKDDNANTIPHVELPSAVTAQLRPYQQHGFNWLAFCYRYGLGGILADDMGLGKTLQAIALIAHVKAHRQADLVVEAPGTGGLETTMPMVSTSSTPEGVVLTGSTTDVAPFLVVAPASVVGNWVNEIKRFAPSLNVEVISHTARTEMAAQRLFARAAQADVVITSYAIFRLDATRFANEQWSGLILDEAQFVKNKSTKANQAARKLKAPFKLAMTGTPLENNVTELWSLLAVVAPGLFSSYERFREEFARPIEAIHKFDANARIKEFGHERIALLRRRTQPLMLRRTKEQVAPELPPRIEQVFEVELEPDHRYAYDLHLTRERQRVLGLLEDFEANKVAVFRALTTLRRAALDVSLVDPTVSASSSKLNALFEHLESVTAEGHRALVFSQFTSYLQLVANRAKQHGIDFAYLDGSTRNRPAVIDGFKNGDAPLFLISLKAGGFGLNLTEADYVFILDPWWNPAVEAQAVDRTHRIGQVKPVNVFRMVAKGTIEEKVMALKARKAALVGAILQNDDYPETDDKAGAKLTAADIRSLLE